ncbi:hypothetical protein GQ457_13G004160 [Hibiscus cannabinus]
MEGRGFAPDFGHRKGGGIHLHHHQVQLAETSRPVVLESPSELAFEGVKKRKVRVVRVNHVRVFETENGGHHRNQRPKNSGMGACHHRPAIGSRHTRRTLRRLRVGLCRSQLGAHSFCAPQPHWISARRCTIDAVHCVALDRPASLTTFDRR